ncbi:MAG TPA: hypothetical protein DCY12_09430 [Candidatus Atribacteria bacterium]|nr:hypothetical protein [Candidatus Atribacteria bacterium]
MICTSSLFYWLNYKKTRVAFQNRVNQVAWITNPASHTLVSNSMSYFKRGGCLVILFKLDDRPHRLKSLNIF